MNDSDFDELSREFYDRYQAHVLPEPARRGSASLKRAFGLLVGVGVGVAVWLALHGGQAERLVPLS